MNNFLLTITDPLLGWLLYLSRDWAIAIIAVATSAILTFSRLISTDQNLLGRCDKDKKRLNELIKQAKKAGDKDALARHRATVGLVAMKLMRAEGKPLLVALLPIALLGVWCWARIGFYPPQDREQVTLNAYFPASAIGEIAHLTPQEGLRSNGWITRIKETPDAIPDQEGIASWKIKGKARPEPYALKINYEDRIHETPFLVGSRKYAANIKFFNEPADRVTVAEVVLKPFWLFGKLHIPWGQWDMFIFPWLLAYLLIAIPFVFILKAMFDIH